MTGAGAGEQQQQQQHQETEDGSSSSSSGSSSSSSSSDSDDETKVDWNTRTVAVLKAELKKRGIPTIWLKKAHKTGLVNHLTESDNAGAMDAAD